MSGSFQCCRMALDRRMSWYPNLKLWVPAHPLLYHATSASIWLRCVTLYVVLLMLLGTLKKPAIWDSGEEGIGLPPPGQAALGPAPVLSHAPRPLVTNESTTPPVGAPKS